MDFETLNRRELQALCKLNKIPANMTNIAMVDALKSLETVEGIEDFLNPSRPETAELSIELPERIEVTSPRVLRTSCRISMRKKAKIEEAESLPATVNRATCHSVMKQLAGKVSKVLKTLLVSCTRKKALKTSSHQDMSSELNECEDIAKNKGLVNHEKNCIPITPVEGFEEILNLPRSETAGLPIEVSERIEITSPRLTRTFTRKKVKIEEAESLPATANKETFHGVMKQLTGEVSEVLKTPLVSCTRKKALETSFDHDVVSELNDKYIIKNECLVNHEKNCIPSTPVVVGTNRTTAITCQETVEKETSTVQIVYSTRRSTRLTAKKSEDPVVMERENSEPVMIDLCLDEASVSSEKDSGNPISEKNVEPGVMESEMSEPVKIDLCLDEASVSSEKDSGNSISEKNVEPGVMESEISEPVKIYLCLDEASVSSEKDSGNPISEKNVEPGSGSMETPTGDNAGEGSVENNVADSNEKVENDCNEVEKVDVVVSESGQNPTIEKIVHVDDSFGEVDNLKVKSGTMIEQIEDVDLEERHNDGENFVMNEVENFEDKSDQQVDNLKPDSWYSGEKQMVVDEKIDVNEETLNDSVVPEAHTGKVFVEADDIDSNAISSDTQNPSEPLILKPEGIQCNAAPNTVVDLIHSNTENPSEPLKLDNLAEVIISDGIEENISGNMDDFMNPNKQQQANMNLEEPQESLMEDMPTIYDDLNQETHVADESAADVSFLKEQNQFSANEKDDVIDHPPLISKRKLENEETINEKDKTTPKSLNKNDNTPSLRQLKKKLKASLLNSPKSIKISENKEKNNIQKLEVSVKENQENIKQEEEEKKSLNNSTPSLRQLKKQLKSFQTKYNKDANKDEKVGEARPALQAV